MVFRNRGINHRFWAVVLLAALLMGQAGSAMAAGSATPDPLAPISLEDWTYSALRTLYQSGLLHDWESTLPPGETLMRFEVAMLTQEAILRWGNTGKPLPPELERLVRVYLPELELLGWRATLNSIDSMETVRFQDLNTIMVASPTENGLVVGGLTLQRLQDGTGQGYYRLVVGSAVANGPIMVNAMRTQQLLLVGGNLQPSVTPLEPGSQSTTSLEGQISLGGNLRVKGGTTYSSGSLQDKGISTEQQVGALVIFPGVEVGAEFRTKAGGHFLALDPADSIGGGISVKIGKVTIQTGLDVLHPSETKLPPAEDGAAAPSPGTPSQEQAATGTEWSGRQASAGIKVELNENSVLQANISLGHERSGTQERSVTSLGIGYQMDSAILLLGYRLLNFTDVGQGEAEQQASAELKVEF